jgi:hypothetical protein
MLQAGITWNVASRHHLECCKQASPGMLQAGISAMPGRRSLRVGAGSAITYVAIMPRLLLLLLLLQVTYPLHIILRYEVSIGCIMKSICSCLLPSAFRASVTFVLYVCINGVRKLYYLSLHCRSSADHASLLLLLLVLCSGIVIICECRLSVASWTAPSR